VPPRGTEELGQSERGRLHDALWMLYVAIKAKKQAEGDHILYKVLFLQAPGKTEEVTLKAHFGPGDDAEAVITIMTPDED